MPTFVGWVPTTIGRLSFSSIGDSYRGSSVIHNVGSASPDRRIFGVVSERDSRVPGWLSRWWRHYPTTAFAIFLSMKPGKIPVPSDGKCSHALKTEPDAKLVGKVYVLNGWGITKGRVPRTLLRGVRFAALLADQRERGPELGDELWKQRQEQLEACWQAELNGIKPTRRFNDLYLASADVELYRSGECRVFVDPNKHSFLAWVKAVGGDKILPAERFEAVGEEMSEIIAYQVFSVVRNLAHKHYHHDGAEPPSWALTKHDPSNDKLWRSATMHALLRSVVFLRRLDTGDAYRKSLGMLAYADAFQRHLGRWSIVRGEAVKLKDSMAYDLAPLKASIEASLKVRELKDQTLRGRMLFAFGTIITALTIVLPALRGFLPEITATSQPSTAQMWVTYPLSWMIGHPVVSLIGAAVLGLLVDWLITRASNNRDVRNLSAAASQLMDTSLAWLSVSLHLGSRLTQFIVIGALTAGLIGLASIWLEIADQSGVAVSLNPFSQAGPGSP